MARVPSKHGRDQALDFQGFLNDLQDWEHSLKDKEKKMRPQATGKGKVCASQSAGVIRENCRQTGEATTADYLRGNTGKYDYLRNYDAVNHLSSSFMMEQSSPDAASEKEQGNEYFKQKRFKEAIDCYSRSIALSPTAVAYANRAMAYLKIRRFQEAEDDCTEALNLDDRYIKAHSRRATARKELGKLKESLEDAEFALRLEPHNQELKKQFTETKALLEKAILQKASGALRGSAQDKQKVGNTDNRVQDQQQIHPVSGSAQITGVAVAEERSKDNGGQVPLKASASVEEIDTKSMGVGSRHKGHELDGFREDAAIRSSDLDHSKTNHGTRKKELKTSVQELASRAASQAMVEAARNIMPPNTAYEFEVAWRGFYGDSALQARFLKAIFPTALPQIFKNALTAPVLIDIVKCVATFFMEDMELAVKILENLTKVPRFGILIMCLSSTDNCDLLKLWNEVFCNEATPIEYTELLDSLHTKYLPKN